MSKTFPEILLIVVQWCLHTLHPDKKLVRIGQPPTTISTHDKEQLPVPGSKLLRQLIMTTQGLLQVHPFVVTGMFP
eukprot:28273-Amphidinium_carterae.1